MSEARITVAGQSLDLLPERAVYWRDADTLLVADTHFGKAATFRTAGLAVPRGTTTGSLGRLDAALERTGARRLVFLGDFLHAREGRAERTLAELHAWRRRWADLEMLLVRGNHDRHAGDPPDELRITCCDGVCREPPFALAHHPRPVDGLYLLAGHLHPAVRLAGRGRQRVRLPCFWVRPELAVLPALGDFTGSADIEPAPGDRLFVVAEGEVVEVGG